MSKIYEKIEYFAGRAPENKAFTYRIQERYESIDYLTLLKYVDSLSYHLADYKGQTIAIIGNNKLEYAVSLLAVLGKIGNAFLIDKELNKKEVGKIFEQKRPDLVLLDEELPLEIEGYPVLFFGDVSRMMKDGKSLQAEAAHAEGLILHTSGTTGEPKCVFLNEEKYYGVIPELNKKWEVVPEHSCLFIIPLYHIYALTSLFHGLYAGINNILEWDYKRIGQVLAETKPHLFMGVPLMYNRIKDGIYEKAGKKIRIALFVSNFLRKCGIDIRKRLFREVYAYFGGEYFFGVSAGSSLPYATSRFFNDIGLPIYNVYGMTETAGPIAINYKGHNRYDSVGEVLDINEVVIRDPDQSGVGRICVKGSNVFEGYLGEKDSTNFDGQFFDTGDLGYLKDRYLYVIGRKKGILIGANGKNISEEELRRRILVCHQVHECHVVMEDNRLIALVNTELDEQGMRGWLERVNRDLPDYKRISDFRITESKIK